MGKLLRILLRVAVFVAIFALAITPSWWLMERLWTSDFSSAQDAESHTFAVLVRRANSSNHYAVALYPYIGEDSKLVTDFDDQNIPMINRDLHASISSENSHYVYFKVLKRGEGYTDVQLETPTTGDFWSKNSYRIKSGQVHLLRGMRFSPFFGLTVAFLPALGGMLGILCCNRLLRHYQRFQ